MPRQGSAAPLPFSPPPPIVAELQNLSDLRDPNEVLQRLRLIDWAFAEDDTGYLNHDLHPYPAKFIPQIPANLIQALSIRGEVVWDPFGGSGTAALEALLLGRRAVSTDLSPLATLVALAKTTALAPEQIEELWSLHKRIRELAESPHLTSLLNRARNKPFPTIPNAAKWFSEHAIRELAYLRDAITILSTEEARQFARVAFSAIIVSVSNQDSETRYSARNKDIQAGVTLAAFCRSLGAALNAHEPLERLLGYRRASVTTADARKAAVLAPNSADLIVTSPPYANANDYHLYHRFRLFWLGFDPRLVGDSEIGSHLRHQREDRGFDLYANEMKQVFQNLLPVLRPGRYAVFVLGDSVFDGKHIDTASQLSRIAVQTGFESLGTISRPLHETRRSFIPAARRVRSEQLLLLRRPPLRQQLVLHPPPYRMWGYEKALSEREIRVLVPNAKRTKDSMFAATVEPYAIDRARRLTFTHEIAHRSGSPSWKTWQAVLENGESIKLRKDPKYVTHGIHAYKGKFYPQLAKALLNLADVPVGGRVLDPFCGSGTVLLEAQLNGYRAFGVDMNPLAALISRAKTAVPTESTVVLDRSIKDFADRVESDARPTSTLDFFAEPVRREIESWFPCPVAMKLSWILSLVEDTPNETAQLVLKTLISSIIRSVSHQDPADLRIRRRKKPLVDAPVVALLIARITEFRQRLKDFGERMSWSPVEFRRASVVEGDARLSPTFREVKEFAGADCIVTSPPYATALPYIDTDRLSLMALLGIGGSVRSSLEQKLTGSREINQGEKHALELEIEACDLANRLGSPTAARLVRRVAVLNTVDASAGFRKRNMGALLYRYFLDMQTVFRQLVGVMRPECSAFFVIGDNRTVANGENIRIRSGDVLAEFGKYFGWRLIDRIPISVTREALLHSKNSITENEVIWFKTRSSQRR
jgi:tRNA G10  N-methylase Trm11